MVICGIFCMKITKTQINTGVILLSKIRVYELAKELQGKANVNLYLGFRDKSLVTCEKDFEALRLNKLVVTTDDGSYKEKGYAIDFMKKDIAFIKSNI